jgi:hypothetical protein
LSQKLTQLIQIQLNKTIMKHALILAPLFLFVACATVSDITPLGAEKYMVGSQVRGGLTSWAEVKAMAVKRATDFCTAKNMKIEVLNMETSGAQGWTPQNADVTFKCVY